VSPNSQTLVVAVVGILATLLSSSLGLYFTARARTAPLRELLYTRQLGLSLDLLHLVGRIRVYAPLLLGSDVEFRDRARNDLTDVVKRLSELSDQAAAIFPATLYAEVQAIVRLVIDFAAALDAGASPAEFPTELTGHGAKMGVMIRTLLGVEELSEESIALYSRRNALDKLAGIEAEDLLRIAQD
jgi:hypothetical protein